MKNHLKIILDKENSYENNITTAIDSDNVIIININSNENEVFGEHLTDDETLKMLTSLNREIEEDKNTLEMNLSTGETDMVNFLINEISLKEKALKKFINHNFNASNIIDLSDEIAIQAEELSEETIANYLKLNEHLFKGKKVFIKGHYYTLDNESYNRVYNLFSEFNNVEIYIEGNNYPTSIDDYKKTIDYIDEIANHIKSKDYSPLEQLIYAYDIVRNNKYNEESENEDNKISRDLSSVVTGDKIVCVGFTNLFNAILNKLQIRNMNYNLDAINKGESGHVRSVVYLQDSKYDIDALYLFDPTWNSMRDEYNCYDDYYFFGKTFNQMKKIDESNGLESKMFAINSAKEIELFEQKLNILNSFAERMYFIITSNALRRGESISKLLGLDYYVTAEEAASNDNQVILNWLKEINKKSNKLLPINAIIQALHRVRKDEHQENPNLFSFDRESFIDLILKSCFASITIGEKNLINILGIDIEDYIKDKIGNLIDNLKLSFKTNNKTKRP